MASEVQAVQAEMAEAKSAVGLYELPGGYISPDGELLKEVEVREMTGADEDLLAARNVPVSRKMNDLLSRCVVRIGRISDRAQIHEAVQDLVIGDRVFLLFAIRRATLGEAYPFNGKCPDNECGKESLYTVDLSTLDVKTPKNPAKRIFDASLPSRDRKSVV